MCVCVYVCVCVCVYLCAFSERLYLEFSSVRCIRPVYSGGLAYRSIMIYCQNILSQLGLVELKKSSLRTLVAREKKTASGK